MNGGKPEVSFLQAEDKPEGVGREPRRILVADDEGAIRELLVATLESDYEVHQAANGAEAVQLAQRWLPHLVLLDVRMPGMDGIAACKVIKTHPSTVAIPVILITAQGDEETVRRGLEAGADTFLSKPFKPLLLLERVRQVLDSPGEHSKLVVASQPVVPDEEIETEQLHCYARDVASLWQHERQLREKAEAANRELEQRLRELTVLNSMFQRHLNMRFQIEESYKRLLAGIRGLVGEAEGALREAEKEAG